MYKTASVVYG